MVTAGGGDEVSVGVLVGGGEAVAVAVGCKASWVAVWFEVKVGGIGVTSSSSERVKVQANVASTNTPMTAQIR
jgi:hypothetical protein